jgi:hypothetical protein
MAGKGGEGEKKKKGRKMLVQLKERWQKEEEERGAKGRMIGEEK